MIRQQSCTCFLTLLTISLLVVAAAAQSPVRTSEFRVNTGGYITPLSPSMAVLTDGKFVVGWNENAPTTNVARVFNRDATPASVYFSLNPFTTSAWKYGPVMSGLPDGGFVSFWGHSFGPRGQRFSSTYAPVGGDIHLESSETWPATAKASNGDVFVINGIIFNPFPIIMKRFNSQMQLISSKQANVISPGERIDSPAIGAAPNGRYTVAWWTSAGEIKARSFDASDNPVGNEFTVNSSLGARRWNPVVRYNSRNELWVVWEGAGDSDPRGIYARRFDSNGVPYGPEWRINGTTSTEESIPNVSISNTDEVLIAWSGADESGFGVLARLYNSAGQPRTDEFRVNAYTPGSQWTGYRDGALHFGGSAVFAWQGSGPQGAGVYLTFMNLPASLNQPPQPADLTPFSGSGTTQTFTATYSDPDGWANIATATLSFHEGPFINTAACHIELNAAASLLRLRDDFGVNWLGPVVVGTFTSLENAACRVDAAAAVFGGAGNILTAAFPVTFKPAFTQNRSAKKQVCQTATDLAGSGGQPLCMGVWIPTMPSMALTNRYRLYHPGASRHLYTTDLNEYTVLGAAGWNQEGVQGRIFDQPATAGGATAVPYYRMFFVPELRHIWTADRNEYLYWIHVAPQAMIGEGIDSFILSQQVPGTIPLFRILFLHSASPIHLWTTDTNEFNYWVDVVKTWKSEGIAGYLFPATAPAAAQARTRAPEMVAVVNAASLDVGPVAPGELVRLYGRGFSRLARVLVNGEPVSVEAATGQSVDIILPERAREAVRIEIEDVYGRSEPFDVPVAAARPGIFANETFGRGLAETLPAEPGTIVVQATGLAAVPENIRATIGGYVAEVVKVTPLENAVGRVAVTLRTPPEALEAGNETASVLLRVGDARTQPGVVVPLK
jgi:uncharacterized protein (TIGR03437 family)